MSWIDDGDWEGEASLVPGTTFSYKFGIVHYDSGKIIRWEEGQNRTLTVPPVGSEVHHTWQVVFTPPFLRRKNLIRTTS